MKGFVPVRMVQGNGMDLSLFQFDYDMSFAVFFVDADRTIYGRYGTRTQSAEGDADSEISMKGLAASMRAALALHANKADHLASLAGKTGPKPPYPTPEEHPQLRRYRPKIEYGPNVAKSCIHCHQIRDIERIEYRRAGKAVPDNVLFPYPIPEVVGLRFDRDTRATVSEVVPGSLAATAGIREGDSVRMVNGQPIVSVADFQWVLERTPSTGGRIELGIDTTEDGVRKVGRPLEKGWRRAGDISWRVSTWDLRRQALGGMRLRRIPDAERSKLGLDDKMALLAEHVGQYNDHAVAKRAGVLKGDILVGYDGLDGDLSEGEVIAHALTKRRAGDEVTLRMRRGDKELDFKIKLQ